MKMMGEIGSLSSANILTRRDDDRPHLLVPWRLKSRDSGFLAPLGGEDGGEGADVAGS